MMYSQYTIRFWCIMIGLFCYKKWGKTQSDYMAFRNDSIHCKETGFCKSTLQICFRGIKQLLNQECEAALKDFNGQVECKLFISIKREKIVTTRLKVFAEDKPLSSKQRMAIKKALKKVEFSFNKEALNERQNLITFPYQTRWVYNIANGKFENI